MGLYFYVDEEGGNRFVFERLRKETALPDAGKQSA
jgi:hypothetical protein